MRPLRWVAIAGIAAAALLVVAAVVAYATIDTQAIARYAEGELARLTGRQIVARGPITIDFWPRLAVVAHDVTIANPSGASQPELARARVVKGAVATWPLLRSRTIVVERLELDGVDVTLETLPNGRGNWVLAPAGAAPAADSARERAPFRLGGAVVVVDAKVTWRPPGGTAVTTVTVPRFDIAPEADGRHAWNGTIDVDGVHWTVVATTGDPLMYVRDRVPLEVDARVAGGGITLTAKGRVERRDTGLGVVADMTLAWEAGNAWLSDRAPAIAGEPGQVSARVEARDKRVALGGLAGTIAGTKLDGSVAIDTKGKVPRLSGRLHADRIDLARERSTAGTPAGATAPASEPPIARLATFDADLDFAIDALHLPNGFEASAARGRVVVEGGRLAADPIDVDFGGGRIAGSLRADSASGLGRIVVSGRGIELARATPKLEAGHYASGGATTFAIDLQGPVQSGARFLAGASGSVFADMGPMQIRGIALDAGGEVITRLFDAVNPFRRVDPSTDIQCFVVRLAVIDGVAHAERSIAVETSRLNVSASGTIDLRKETVELVVRPRARKSAAIPSVDLAEVVHVTGPIRRPTYRLGTLGAAKAAVTIGGAVATGGWSLLATPLLNAGDDKTPCATARAGGKAPAASQGSSPGADPAKADPMAPLRGLFGR